LARRAAIAGGKARGRDLAKSRRLCVAGGLAEIGVVEDVERIGPERKCETLKYLGLLLARDVRVRESRAGDGVALDVAMPLMIWNVQSSVMVVR
jgi:hypothetical protein